MTSPFDVPMCLVRKDEKKTMAVTRAHSAGVQCVHQVASQIIIRNIFLLCLRGRVGLK